MDVRQRNSIMFHRPPKKYSEYLVNVPQSIDWILKSIWRFNKFIENSGGSNNSNTLIDGGSFASPNNYTLIDGGGFV